MREIRLTTSEPESPATMTFLENLRPEFERAGLSVDPVRRRLERPGKLPGGLVTVALVLPVINLVADIVSAVYTVLQHAQTKRLAKPQPGATSPSNAVPPRPPLVISVRLGSAGGEHRVASLAEAKDLDVRIEGLPADQPIEIVVAREYC